MHPPTRTDNFLHVAAALLDDVEGTGAEVAEWTGCENARFRSAVSRAYYAVFLEVKYRVIGLRPEWRRAPATFPKNSVHGVLASAIRVARAGPILSRDIRQLSDARKRADYDWNSAYERRIAERQLTVARDLVHELSRLTDREWQAVADRLHRLAR